ncbi:HalOD1 output domain-containing protein [Halobaculum limi]|uniref:HalOD1 output domain-containing protein n=1 Tax=Halobaculum limi TaxID=3031916 RepID=UPI00240510D3|nr:HalOD1 output domain-containing protein [Halobaculum sp. YSMS11]
MRDPSEEVAVTYDEESGAYTARFDPDELAPSIAVVESTSSIRQVDPERHAPLFEVVDPEALDRICLRQGVDNDGEFSDETVVEFTYLAHRIRVTSGGVITITPKSTTDGE